MYNNFSGDVMKIERFSKQKNGMYLLSLEEGSKIKVHEDLILKYDLLLNKKIEESLLEQIVKENQIYEVYEIALKYLNTRLRCYKELYNYLVNKGYDLNIVDTVIEMLSKQGYLNDKIYAASFVHDKILMSNYGPKKIKCELECNGISNEVIEEIIISFNVDLEKDRIDKLINKQIRANRNKGSMLLKRKIQTYLLNLGYSSNLINQALNGKKLVSEDCYQKEYDKLYTKLSKKYSGKELEYKLKQKMFQKGFMNSDYE